MIQCLQYPSPSRSNNIQDLILALNALIITMQAVVALCALSTVSAFMGQTAKPSSALNAVRSKSVPFAEQPAALDGTLPGDVGFDPLGITGYWSDVSRLMIYFNIRIITHLSFINSHRKTGVSRLSLTSGLIPLSVLPSPPFSG
jgi:hypothetical protein